MRPLAALNGILLGSIAAIAVGAAVTLLIVAVLRAEHPRLQAEWQPLAKVTLLFASATVAFAAAFIGQLQRRPWRWYAQSAALLTLLGLVAAFWPR